MKNDYCLPDKELKELKELIQDKLLPHYTKVLERVKLQYDLSRIVALLVSTNTDRGICNCAYEHFKYGIYGHPIIERYSIGDRWHPYPGARTWESNFKGRVIDALQFRIDTMQKILSTDLR